MNKVFTGLVRVCSYATHFNLNEDFECTLILKKNSINIILIKGVNVLVDETIEKIHIKQNSIILQEIEILCMKLDIYKNNLQ